MKDNEQSKKPSRFRILKWFCAAFFALLLVSGALAYKWFHSHVPKEAMLDVRAALAARHSARPVDSYLEARYGSMKDPANREKVLLDFFNVDHIKGINFLVSRIPAERRNSNITDMAEWISNYRQSMTPDEKTDLRAALCSTQGVVVVRQATSQYLQQDVHYRAANAIVISELMTTLTSLQEP